MGGSDGASGGDSGGSKDKLVIASALEPGSLNILRDGDDGNELINWSISEPLVDRTSEGLVPVLAEELPVHDKKDPTIWHVKLRQGVKFTDGEPFNAEAVKQNIDMLLDPDFGTTINGTETLAGAKVVDEYDVDIQTTQPDPWLLYRIITIRFEAPKAAADPDAYSQNPVGTGPYKFVSWDKGQRITLERNDDYWGGDDAPIKDVEFRFIPDASARIAALQAGEVDMVTGLTPEDTDKVEQVLQSDGPANGLTIRINLETPPYDNVAFRQALIYAINRQSIVDNLWNGEGEVEQCQMLPPGEVGFNDSLSAYPYDPEKAKELLSQVDLPDDFKVKMYITTGYYPKDNEIGQAISADWEAVGLKTDVQYVSSDKWLDDLLAGGDKTSANSPVPLTYLPLDYYGMYASRITNRLYDRTNVLSTMGDAYPEIDGLFKTAESSFDQEQAAGAYEQIFKLACDDALNIPLIDYPDIWGASDAVKYEPGPGVITRVHLADISVS